MRTDNITVYIGWAFIALAAYAFNRNLGDSFVIGCAISAFLFTLADVVDRITKWRLFINIVVMVFRYVAVLCFIAVPIWLSDAKLSQTVVSRIDHITLLLGLGIVLIMMGLRQESFQKELTSNLEKGIELAQQGNDSAKLLFAWGKILARHLDEAGIDKLQLTVDEANKIDAMKAKLKDDDPMRELFAQRIITQSDDTATPAE